MPFSPQASFFRKSAPDYEPNIDIAHRIRGLYRVFDLISEQGGGGLGGLLSGCALVVVLTNSLCLVDKIIIAQDGLKRLINDMCTGAYVALTRVDFKALDYLAIRPIGVYGDRGEIIKFLSSLKIIDETT
jgi:hypothetical protein